MIFKTHKNQFKNVLTHQGKAFFFVGENGCIKRNVESVVKYPA